jgi:hypothetical protein
MLLLASCNQQIRLAIPTAFSEQATMTPVKGDNWKHILINGYSISKIKRPVQWFPGSTTKKSEISRENLLLNQVGIDKSKVTEKSKEKFRFSISSGKGIIHVQAMERVENTDFSYQRNKRGNGSFTRYSILQEYSYTFWAKFTIDSSEKVKNWELLMTNMYDRKQDKSQGLLMGIKPDDNGLATNGSDTIFIKGLAINKTVSPDGKERVWPREMFGGYELSTHDGVVAVIDVIGKGIWFYNELEAHDRLMISAIATAIFARTKKIT